LIGPSPIFWDIGHSPIEAPLWTASCKMETNVLPMAHLFSLYTRELNFVQTIWCYRERFRGQLWKYGNLGNFMGTHKEHDGNKGKKKNISPPLPFQKEKNWTCHESMLSLSLAAWNFYFENSLSPYLAWANGMEQPQKRKNKKIPSSQPPPTPGPSKEKNWAPR